MSAPPLLRTVDLSRAFGGLKAVDGVGFAIERGEIRALIGPNGAGKTTFVSLLSGRLLPDRGRVVFDGRDVTRLPAHRRVRLGLGYTFQITSLFPRLSARENVALAAGGDGKIVDEVLARVGLADRAETLAASLPYGHGRLLEFAMGLALRPKLLILDEPTQGLSDGEIDRFVGLVREVAAGTATVLLIEHNMDVVMRLSTRITVMERGRVLAEGAPEAIRADPEVQRAYLGAPVAEAAP